MFTWSVGSVRLPHHAEVGLNYTLLLNWEILPGGDFLSDGMADVVDLWVFCDLFLVHGVAIRFRFHRGLCVGVLQCIRSPFSPKDLKYELGYRH